MQFLSKDATGCHATFQTGESLVWGQFGARSLKVMGWTSFECVAINAEAASMLERMWRTTDYGTTQVDSRRSVKNKLYLYVQSI